MASLSVMIKAMNTYSPTGVAANPLTPISTTPIYISAATRMAHLIRPTYTNPQPANKQDIRKARSENLLDFIGHP